LKTGTRVERLEIRGGEAVGVVARSGFRRRLETADLIVLAAGGLGTPEILAASGIPGAPRLSVDPVLCVAARVPGAEQNRELPMPFYVHTDGFMISPYFDHLSFFFNRKWRPPAEGILSLMIKLADESTGSFGRGRLEKTLTDADRGRIDKAVGLCTEIFGRLGIPARELFLGTLNAGHPGGMFPLTAADSAALHPGRLPDNVYIADASLFPAALGRPPILTVAALARKIARRAAGAV
jgi:choline dehydrogenase-like flavoprotein